MFSCRALLWICPNGLELEPEWDSQPSNGPPGAWQLPWREMAGLNLPSVCPTTMNTEAIRDRVLLQPRNEIMHCAHTIAVTYPHMHHV